MKPSLLIPVLLVLAGPTLAQTRDDGGIWGMWFTQGRFGAADSELGAWRWSADLQPRWSDDGEHYSTTLLRPGLGYALSDRVSLWAGYTWIHNDPIGGTAFVGQDVWQQLLWNVPVAGVTLTSRTRLEQRFREDFGETGWRLRQFVKATLPIAADGDLFLAAFDEVLHDVNDTAWGQRTGMRDNRAFAGLGWKFDAGGGGSGAIEIGYLNQWLDRPGTDAMNHLLAINLFLNF